MIKRFSSQTLAKFASLYAGLAYGLYWIPLRALEQAGLHDVLPALMFNLIPMVLILPLIVWRWPRIRRAPLHFHITGIIVGLSLVGYTNAFLYTDVVRVLILFYLTPIWGFLLARVFLGDLITPIRWISILLGIGGMLTIFGIDTGLPLPDNIGDWVALVAGIFWAIASLMMLMGKESPIDYALWFFLWNGLAAILVTLIFFAQTNVSIPDGSAFMAVLPWMIPLAIILVIPAGFAVIYGPTQLNPGIAGILFMVEIGVGTITASIMTDEAFGLRELLGVLMITGAALIEPLRDLIQHRYGRGQSEYLDIE
ncbi:MAG: DMT family transporter [Gammaproteobacteria bacterium]|nr:DMT family transporter [Gammaproteobacteria bacterium]